VQNFWKILLCIAMAIVFATTIEAQILSSSNVLSLAELQSMAGEHGGAVRSFQVEAIACAVVPERRMLALQDKTSTVLLELPVLNGAIKAGDHVTVTGNNCLVDRSRFGIRISPAVVNNDYLHPALLKTGSVFLEAGFQPISLKWFNAWTDSILELEYAGPNMPRQKISNALLWQKRESGTVSDGFQRGLNYLAYNGEWNFLPDFSQLKPVAAGVATNFSLAYRARQENTALVFSGYLEIRHAGIYTFYLNSDDGSRLEVGRPEVSCSVEPKSNGQVFLPETFDQALADGSRDHWIELEGEVAFAGASQGNLEMDLAGQGNYLPVTIIGGAALLATNLLHQRIHVEGIGKSSVETGQRRFAGLVVPSMAQAKLYPLAQESTAAFSTNDLLTTVAQVRQLKRDQAHLHIPVKITGVVIAASPISLVLQDASGGVYIHYKAIDASDQPAVGQLLEVKGRTGSGDFSPVIFADNVKFLGNAAMPEPIHPTRDQLMNGSLDAQYVEIRGIVTALSNSQITLLTPDGKVTIKGDDTHPLPQISDPGIIGNVVRMRGHFATFGDRQTRQVIGGTFFLFPDAIEVEELTPSDPFLLPPTRASDLLRFDARASALQRIKLVGQVIHARLGECFLLDEKVGVRVLTTPSQIFKAGDLIEATGYPRLNGSGPILQEALIRKTGYASLPEPVSVSADDLLDERHDSTLVQIQAVVVSDAMQMDRRILELQAGTHHFLASLKAGSESSQTFSPGTRLQLRGVYSSAGEDLIRDDLDSFELLLNYPADIVVLQKPPWWTVRRAIIVAAVLAGGLGIMMIWILQLRRKVDERTTQWQSEIEERQRVEQHRIMEQERTRVAQDLHDELGVGLTQVGILGSLAKNPSLSDERKNQCLEQLSEAARTLVTGLDEIVWAINPKYDSAASLASYFALFAQRFLNLAEIACRFDPAENLPDYPMDSRLRHGVFLAFKEALNNVVRHSKATEVRLNIAVARDQLLISITDNGCGFEIISDVPGNDGVIGIHQRMEKLGGRCVIDSGMGSGTKVELSLPLENHGS
jgi:signal transduction histidine kinase